MNFLEWRHLHAEKRALDDTLAKLSPQASRALRQPLEQRRERINTQLDTDPNWDAESPIGLISFSGNPVREHYGIDTDFARQVLQHFADTIVALSGRRATPMLTKVVSVSFGFQMESGEPQRFLMEEPAVRYDPERLPDVQEALDLLNQVALLDQKTACIQYPAGDPDQHEAVVEMLREKANRTVDHRVAVLSFDIDLTLRTGEEQEEGMTLIEPDTISELQQLGYVVGTCSDREPDDQRKTMQAMGQEPHFCIPKEMLGWAKILIPGERHLHIGDDQQRDRDIAHGNGWEHRWPHEFPGN